VFPKVGAAWRPRVGELYYCSGGCVKVNRLVLDSELNRLVEPLRRQVMIK